MGTSSLMGVVAADAARGAWDAAPRTWSVRLGEPLEICTCCCCFSFCWRRCIARSLAFRFASLCCCFVHSVIVADGSVPMTLMVESTEGFVGFAGAVGCRILGPDSFTCGLSDEGLVVALPLVLAPDLAWGCGRAASAKRAGCDARLDAECFSPSSLCWRRCRARSLLSRWL